VKTAGSFFLMVVITTLVLFLLPLLGKRMLSPSVIFHPLRSIVISSVDRAPTHQNSSRATETSNDIQTMFYWKVRFPRTLFAILAGAGLSLAGMVFQAVFRNPLATPFTLGVSSGASFGATFYFLLPIKFAFLGLSGTTWFAFGGALLAVLIVHFLSWKRNTSSEEMLLAGVAVSLFFSSLILLMQYVAEQYQVFIMIRWVMGGLADSSTRHIGFLAPIVLAGMTFLLIYSRELNILMTGNERAMTLGVDVVRIRLITFYLVSLLVGGIVSICGPIGFVGLIVPHICRRIVGSDHRRLAPASALFGGVFLALCDTVARSVMAPVEIPVGVITSLLGGPFFLGLLLRKQK
jgi:iron complex transport system permease protein